MRKSDHSIKNITIAAIKRSTMPPIAYRYASIYEGDRKIWDPDIVKVLELEEGEKLIAATIIDDRHWTVISTRKITTRIEKGIWRGKIDKIVGHGVGETESILDLRDAEYLRGELTFESGAAFPFFFESGAGKMIMIKAFQTIRAIL